MAEQSEGSQENNTNEEVWKGSDEIFLGMNEEEESDGDGDGDRDSVSGEPKYLQIDSETDIWNLKIDMLTPKEIKALDFLDVEVAYKFYNEYGRVKGFSIRKHKTFNDYKGDLLWKSFVCSRQGYREKKSLERVNRKRAQKPMTRCECIAEFRVKVEAISGRWFVSRFRDVHNHELVSKVEHGGMLRSHRKMTPADIEMMNLMRSIGIGTPLIYAFFGRLCRGFNMIGFRLKDMYNEIDRQRRMQEGDAKETISYLKKIASIDGVMFWRHAVDNEGKLKHLFWCDGVSQFDYNVFGDVLAFDATYGKNKYKCPVVVLSGVNHHLQSIVFGTAVVSDETEETYVWMLEQFLNAMNGKCPKSVITDGDNAMRKAIQRVMPEAHHRLCAWHLSRNVGFNVKNSDFVKGFNNCMLYDYEVSEFEEKWKLLVETCKVGNIEWVKKVYKKKQMWATAYMRGLFFAGLRTTSRVESLHSKFGKYVGSRNSLYEFLQNYHRCIDYLRNNEYQADFDSWYGTPVAITHLPLLEKSAAAVYTLNVFYLFQRIIKKSGRVKVAGLKKTSNNAIYTVIRYGKNKGNREWHVFFNPLEIKFRCSCMGMEAFGLPCEHIVVVLIELDIEELPMSLVLGRWTKRAKEGWIGGSSKSVGMGDNTSNSRHLALLNMCIRMCSLASRSIPHFNELKEKVHAHIVELEEFFYNGCSSNTNVVGNDIELGNLAVVRTKGCGSSAKSDQRKRKRVQKCKLCKRVGHNKSTCRKYYSSVENEGVPEEEEEQEGDDGLEEEDEGDASVEEEDE